MRIRLLLVAILFALACLPTQWYPESVRLVFSDWFGAQDYRARPDSLVTSKLASEVACPEDFQAWREAQTIAGVDIRASPTCVADNPSAVAAFVRGTNNVSQQVLLDSGLTPDAVEKGRDLDGDGDPDEIHIRLEVAELNGSSPDLNEPTTQYSIAPGIKPGFWVFVPKTFGMATENFESIKARSILRVPSPADRLGAARFMISGTFCSVTPPWVRSGSVRPVRS